MGNSQTKNRTEATVDKEISNKLSKEQREGRAKVKLLLLGTGESGKSAIFKQMKILYSAEPSKDELSRYIQVIHSNIHEAMTMLCNAVDEMGLSADLQAIDEFQEFRKTETTSLSAPTGLDSKTVGDLVSALWQDPAVQKAWNRRNETQVVESHKVFLDEIDRIRDHAYLPTIIDSVLARVRSTGVITDVFDIQGINFELYDVGGQRNERRKWIHVFDDVDAIIFVVSLSEYDQNCFEDKDKNRMMEAIELFRDITQNNAFINTDVILFLNKMDLFKDKLQGHPIQEVELWKDYAGSSFEEGWKFFHQKLIDVSGVTNAGSSKEIFTHVTCATDTNNIHHVFNSCRESILKTSLLDSGLI